MKIAGLRHVDDDGMHFMFRKWIE